MAGLFSYFLFYIFLIFFGIKYGRQVHCELCQVWPCKQLDQAEHGLRADAVNRWECILPLGHGCKDGAKKEKKHSLWADVVDRLVLSVCQQTIKAKPECRTF